jgi:hypothetical protein
MPCSARQARQDLASWRRRGQPGPAQGSAREGGWPCRSNAAGSRCLPVGQGWPFLATRVKLRGGGHYPASMPRLTRNPGGPPIRVRPFEEPWHYGEA